MVQQSEGFSLRIDAAALDAALKKAAGGLSSIRAELERLQKQGNINTLLTKDYQQTLAMFGKAENAILAQAKALDTLRSKGASVEELGLAYRKLSTEIKQQQDDVQGLIAAGADPAQFEMLLRTTGELEYTYERINEQVNTAAQLGQAVIGVTQKQIGVVKQRQAVGEELIEQEEELTAAEQRRLELEKKRSEEERKFIDSLRTRSAAQDNLNQQQAILQAALDQEKTVLSDLESLYNRTTAIDETERLTAAIEKQRRAVNDHASKLEELQQLQKTDTNLMDVRSAEEMVELLRQRGEQTSGTIVLEQKLRAEIEQQQQLVSELVRLRERAQSSEEYEKITDEIDDQNRKLATQRGLIKDLQMERSGATRANETMDRAGGYFQQGAKFAQTLGLDSELLDTLTETAVQFREISDQARSAIDTFSQLREMMGKGDKQTEKLTEGANTATDAMGDVGGSMDSLGKQSRTGKSILGGMESGIMKASAAFAGLQIGIAAWEQFSGQTAANAEKNVQRALDKTDKQLELQRMIDEGDVAGFEELQKQLQDTANETALATQNLKNLGAAGTSGGDQLRTIIGHVFGDSTIYGATGDELYKLKDAAAAAQAELAQLTPELEAEIRARKNVLDATDKLGEVERDLLQVRIRAEDALMQHQRDMAEYESDLAFRRGRELQDRRRDDEKTYRNHLDNLKEQEADYQESRLDAIANYEKELSQTIQDYNEQEFKDEQERQKSLLEMEQEYQKSYAETLTEYEEEVLESKDDHLKELLDAEEEYQLERKRRIEDLNDDLLQAEFENDIKSFLETKRAGEKDLRRMDEDHQRQMDESREQYEEQRVEREVQHQETLAEMRRQYEEQRAETLANYAQEREDRRQEHAEQLTEMQAAHDTQLAELKTALDEQLAETRASYDKERAERDEQRQWQDARDREDVEMERAKRDEQLRLQLEGFKQEENQLVAQQDNLNRVLASGGQVQIKTFERTQAEMVGVILKNHQVLMAGLYTPTRSGYTNKADNIYYNQMANTDPQSLMPSFSSVALPMRQSIESRAAGGDVRSGEWYKVNDNQEPFELFRSNQSGQIYPLSQMPMPQQGGGTNFKLNIEQLTIGSDISRAEITTLIGRWGERMVKVVAEATRSK